MWHFLSAVFGTGGRVEWQLTAGTGADLGISESGLKIAIQLARRPVSRFAGIATARNLVQAESIPWLVPGLDEWKVDTDALRIAHPNLCRLDWLRGEVFLAPEYEPEREGIVRYNAKFDATVAIYLTPETVSRANERHVSVHQGPTPEPIRTPDTDIELVHRHGSGCFGIVWEGRQRSLARRVAVKIIRPSMATVACAIEHAQAIARLNHPNIVAVYQTAVVRDPDTNSVVDAAVLEWLDGQTLGQRLRGPGFTIPEARRILLGIVDAITHMHARGVVHSDLHAGNVILCGDTAKVIDISYSESHSLARLTTAPADELKSADVKAAGWIARHVLHTTHIAAEKLAPVHAQLVECTELEQLRGCICAALD